MGDVATTNGALTRGRPFAVGNPGGPGRPLGSRNKLSEDFLGEMVAVFREHGRAALERVAREDPSTFVKVVASLVPKELGITGPGGGPVQGEFRVVFVKADDAA